MKFLRWRSRRINSFRLRSSTELDGKHSTCIDDWFSVCQYSAIYCQSGCGPTLYRDWLHRGNEENITYKCQTGCCDPCFLFAIGSALFVYYQQHPQLLPAGFNTGGILPLFVVTEMPVGIAGLIIAAIFAAAQSSISSSLNSISSCFNSDIYQRLSHKKNARKPYENS